MVSCLGNSLFFMTKERLIGVIKMKKNGLVRTHEDYLEKIYEYPLQVLPIEKYIKTSIKIPHKCIKCGNEIDISPNAVLSKLKHGWTICQKCGGASLYVGKNDLWTTDPDIAKCLVNPEIGYTVTRCSDKKADWYCQNCGTIVKQKSINNVVKVGLTCPICSRGRSMGHRIINSILEICDISYINEVEFSWSCKKRYDVFANDNCIIEINGEQHYKDCYLLKMSNKTLQDQKENDTLKYNLAIQNGIKNYIVIDARKSDYSYIIDSIKKNTQFIRYIDANSKIKFVDIPWKEVFDKYNDLIAWRILRDYQSGKMIKDIASNNHIEVNAISKYLKLLSEYGYCNYEPSDQIKQKVRCITTGEEFDSMKEAGEKYGIQPIGIYRVCRGLFNRTTAGRLTDGTRLKWEYI